MKTFKSLSLTVFFILISFISLAQKGGDDGTGTKPTSLTCNVGSGLCNTIVNNIFAVSNPACLNPGNTNQFLSCVPSWTYSHGTPRLNRNLPLIGTGINHASMFAASVSSGLIYSDGIATGISQTIPGHTYNVSFMERYANFSGINAFLDDYYVVLLTCSAFNSIKVSNQALLVNPTIPSSGALVISSGHNVSNTAWETKQDCFVADGSYSVLWIFPKETSFNVNHDELDLLEFGLPEIVDVTSFDAGSAVNTPPSCQYLIGPNTPNCAVSGAVFTWHGPNANSIPNNPIVPNNNQQITVDAGNPDNVGTWILTMTLPNAPGSSNCGAQASIYVPSCCPQSQMVSVADDASQISGLDVFPYTISQNNTNVICYRWEWDDRIKLKSTMPTGNTWYFNNYQIPTSYTGYQDEYLTIPRCPNQLIPQFCQGSWNVDPIEIKVSNPNSCNTTSTPIYVVFNPLYLSTDAISYVGGHPGQNTIASLFDYGSSSSYTWHNNDPGVTITPINANWSKVSIFIPLSYANSTLNFSIDIANQWCTNSSYNNTSASCTNYCLSSFNTQIQVLSSITGPSSNVKLTQMYPNPAIDKVTVTSNNVINYIEISGLMDASVKVITVNGSKSIQLNISDLRSGIYTCKIVTSTGIEYQKLIIKRP